MKDLKNLRFEYETPAFGKFYVHKRRRACMVVYRDVIKPYIDRLVEIQSKKTPVMVLNKKKGEIEFIYGEDSEEEKMIKQHWEYLQDKYLS